MVGLPWKFRFQQKTFTSLSPCKIHVTSSYQWGNQRFLKWKNLWQSWHFFCNFQVSPRGRHHGNVRQLRNLVSDKAKSPRSVLARFEDMGGLVNELNYLYCILRNLFKLANIRSVFKFLSRRTLSKKYQTAIDFIEQGVVKFQHCSLDNFQTVQRNSVEKYVTQKLFRESGKNIGHRDGNFRQCKLNCNESVHGNILRRTKIWAFLLSFSVHGQKYFPKLTERFSEGCRTTFHGSIETCWRNKFPWWKLVLWNFFTGFDQNFSQFSAENFRRYCNNCILRVHWNILGFRNKTWRWWLRNRIFWRKKSTDWLREREEKLRERFSVRIK